MIDIVDKIIGNFLGKDTQVSEQIPKFWDKDPVTSNRTWRHESLNESRSEDFYKYQCEALASFMLIGDKKPVLPIDTYAVDYGNTLFSWINKGELIAGSFVASSVHHARHPRLGPNEK